MKKQRLLIIGTVIFTITSSSAIAASGEALFKQHCTVCHPDGGNVIKPTHSLHKNHLEQQGIKNWEGIVKYMRTPGPGMTAFDAKTISDQDAKAIAEYVLKTFK